MNKLTTMLALIALTLPLSTMALGQTGKTPRAGLRAAQPKGGRPREPGIMLRFLRAMLVCGNLVAPPEAIPQEAHEVTSQQIALRSI
jgi:hypothetical protein